MLYLPHEWANLWGKREGRVDCHSADRAVAPVVPSQSETPLPLVGHSEQIQGSRTRICKCGGRGLPEAPAQAALPIRNILVE